jgi:hypothetical protein
MTRDDRPTPKRACASEIPPNMESSGRSSSRKRGAGNVRTDVPRARELERSGERRGPGTVTASSASLCRRSCPHRAVGHDAPEPLQKQSNIHVRQIYPTRRTVRRVFVLPSAYNGLIRHVGTRPYIILSVVTVEHAGLERQ